VSRVPPPTAPEEFNQHQLQITASNMFSADTTESWHLIFITMYNSTLNQCSSTARQYAFLLAPKKTFTTKENKPVYFLMKIS
jgi:hypothetical protein